ncbi:MAG TPA: GNAT family N-acetyltransferase [archaeon]|nr:GNAT family N-acetyltransferase [archaeon]
MQIRLATREDAPAIAKMIRDHAQTDYMGYATFDEGYIKDKMKRDVFLVAEDGGLAGCLRISLVDVDLAEIRTLSVYEEFRRKGLASRMLEVGFDLMEKRKIRKVIARIKAGNTPAIDMFKKFGFEQEGYFKEHYRKGIDVVQMAKFL